MNEIELLRQRLDAAEAREQKDITELQRLNLKCVDLIERLATAEEATESEKKRRIHWQGLAYTGMCVVDAVLNNSIRLGEGTTEESMPVNARMAIDKMNHLRREWAAKGGRDERVVS